MNRPPLTSAAVWLALAMAASAQVDPLPMAVSNNAVTGAKMGKHDGLYSFMGIGAKKNMGCDHEPSLRNGSDHGEVDRTAFGAGARRPDRSVGDHGARADLVARRLHGRWSGRRDYRFRRFGVRAARTQVVSRNRFAGTRARRRGGRLSRPIPVRGGRRVKAGRGFKRAGL